MAASSTSRRRERSLHARPGGRRRSRGWCSRLAPSHRGRTGTDVSGCSSAHRRPLRPPGDLAVGPSWGLHRGEYFVPPGRTETAFGFVAVSTAGSGPAGRGASLDVIYIGTALRACRSTCARRTAPAPCSTADRRRRRRGRLRGELRNLGGLPADAGLVTVPGPRRDDRVPGSPGGAVGPAPGPRTDAADGDRAGVAPDGRAVEFGLGAPAQALGALRLAPNEAWVAPSGSTSTPRRPAGPSPSGRGGLPRPLRPGRAGRGEPRRRAARGPAGHHDDHHATTSTTTTSRRRPPRRRRTRRRHPAQVDHGFPDRPTRAGGHHDHAGRRRPAPRARRRGQRAGVVAVDIVRQRRPVRLGAGAVPASGSRRASIGDDRQDRRPL